MLNFWLPSIIYKSSQFLVYDVALIYFTENSRFLGNFPQKLTRILEYDGV